MKPPVPRELSWVANLFLFNGVCSIITMIVSALDNRALLDFSFIGIFAYPGLLRFSNGWRFYALVCSWLAIVLMPVIGVLSLTASHANINIVGFVGPAIPSFLVLPSMLFWFCVALWQLKVLTRPDVTALFAEHPISRF